MKHVSIWVIVIALFAGGQVAQAGQKEPQSVLDTPEGHYKEGMRRLDEGDLQAAITEFQRVVRLDENFAGAYLGFAMVRARQEKYKEALRDIKTARRKNNKWADTYIMEGRILVQQAKKNWLKDALKAFEKARKLDERDDRIDFYIGEAYWAAEAYPEAEKAYSNTIELKGDLQALALRRLSQVQMVHKAAPGTEVGIRIAKMDPVTRADLCALLIEEMKVEDLVEKLGKKTYDTGFTSPDASDQSMVHEIPIDIQKHWGISWIKRILKLNLPSLNVDSGGLFKPDDALSRKDLAVVIQGLLVLISGNENLRTQFIGKDSRFPDVRSDVYYFNAASLVVERGLMQVGKLEGTFQPETAVSGAEAVLAIQDLRQALVKR